MKINEVEQQVGVSKKNIRFYELQGLLHPKRNSENGYREYDETDVLLLKKIKLLRKLSLPPDQAKNAMASVAAASYRLTMKEGTFPIDDLAEKLQAFYAQETIPYTKETKKSVVELDLKQGIYELDADDEGAIYMLVNASSSGNIKPTMIFEKFCEFAGCEIPASAIQVTRLETYTDAAIDGDAHRFIPLADVV